jgi:anti-sigma factor RsiW
MTGHEWHAGEELLDLLDGRLAEPRRAVFQAHVEACARCRRELAALESARNAAAAAAASAGAAGAAQADTGAVPESLAARVRAALDAEDRATLLAPQQVKAAPWRRRAWITAGLATAALAILFFRPEPPATVPALAAADFRAFDAGSTELGIRSTDPKEIEAWFAANGAAFVTRVIDLAMMQYQLAGGRINRLGSATSAFYAYRGPDDVALVCQMYLGRITDLPTADEVREHEGIAFHIHRDAELTLVFWQEGDVVCVLVSSIPLEEVVQLAFAKAVRAGRIAD